MSTKKTHWKKFFNSDFLGVYSLPDGNDLIGTIKEVKEGKAKDQNGKESKVLTCHFSDLQKPMILNVTNCKVIAQLYGTTFIEEWRGKRIQLYCKKGIKAFGSVTEGLRIRDFIPKAPVAAEKTNLKKLIVKALENYPLDDKSDIVADLKAKRDSKQDTIIYLTQILKSIKDATTEYTK